MIIRANTYKLERNREIYEARKAGAKLQELADKYGLSRERIRQIYLKEERYFRFMNGQSESIGL